MVAQRFRPAVADSISGSIPHLPQAMAPRAVPNYRFAVGTRVMCKVDEWRAGTIIALDYREDHWPLGQVAPYQVALADGSLICVPSDIDQLCREISQLTTAATTTATCQFRSSNLSVYHSGQLASIPEAEAAQTRIPGANPPGIPEPQPASQPMQWQYDNHASSRSYNNSEFDQTCGIGKRRNSTLAPSLSAHCTC